MSLERTVDAFAGFMVLLSVALTYWVDPVFVCLSVFVGANLFQQSFTGFCPVAILFRKLGVRSERELVLQPHHQARRYAVAIYLAVLALPRLARNISQWRGMALAG